MGRTYNRAASVFGMNVMAVQFDCMSGLNPICYEVAIS